MRPATKPELIYMDADAARWRPSPHQIDQLVRRAQEGNRSAEERLFMAFTHMVAKIAAEPFFRNLPENAGQPDAVDLIQVGHIQLILAIRKYDTAGEHRFAGYAAACIRGGMRTAATTQSSSIHVPRKANETHRAPDPCESLDAARPCDAVRLHLVSHTADDTHEKAVSSVTDGEAFGLSLVYSQDVDVDELTADDAAAAALSRKAQNAAHRLTLAAGGATVAPAPRGCLSPVSYALICAMPALQMKQQTALHLFHTNRLSIEQTAAQLSLTPAKAEALLSTSTRVLLANVDLENEPSHGQLRRAVAAHSALRERALLHLDEQSAALIKERLFFGTTTSALAAKLHQSIAKTRDQGTQARKDLARHERRLLLLYRP